MNSIYAIKILNTKEYINIKDKLFNFLSNSSKEKLSNYKNIICQQRSLLGEVIVRNYFNKKHNIPFQNIDFKYNKTGKPHIKNINDFNFNISHSGEWVVVVFSDDEIGVDIEKIKDINFEIAQRFFSEEECDNIFTKNEKEKLEQFFIYWTIKESFLKAIGTGLTRPLNTFTVKLIDNKYHIFEDTKKLDWNIYLNKLENYFISVCSKANEKYLIKEININDL